MVTPKRAWSHFFGLTRGSAPSALRLITIGALLFSAFVLHERASELEQRERSLEQRIGAFARLTRSQENSEHARRVEPSAPFLEKIADSSTVDWPRFADSAVHRADYQEVRRAVVSQTRDE